ncbi:MAG: phytoene/squalene synthase family protein [Candidatus Aceula meridiana]|nr:phytoene/squalene synthase family protein [Candidatus Aceula meridiana]
MTNKSKKLAQKGFVQAKAITKQASRTFYFASCFLPRKKRLAAYSIYAICRLSDEAVDGPQEQKKQSLEDIRQNIQQAYGLIEITDPLLFAFRATVQAHGIPKKYFDELISGMRMDLTKTRYQNFNELYPYCYKVAGVIGLIMLKVFDYENIIAEKYAVDLGVAMQLTNILRDIKEDCSRGRIYLPIDELAKQRIHDENIQNNIVDDKFKNLIKFQIKRARSYYVQASYGIDLITDKRCRLVAFLMLELYAGILKKIAENNYDVFKQRACVPSKQKFALLPGLMIRFARGKFLFTG